MPNNPKTTRYQHVTNAHVSKIAMTPSVHPSAACAGDRFENLEAQAAMRPEASDEAQRRRVALRFENRRRRQAEAVRVLVAGAGVGMSVQQGLGVRAIPHLS